jgi:hypothetical protein
MTSVFAFGGVGGQFFLNFITKIRLLSNCHNNKGTVGRKGGGVDHQRSVEEAQMQLQ